MKEGVAPHEIFSRGGLSFLLGIVVGASAVNISSTEIRLSFLVIAIIAFGLCLRYARARLWLICALFMALGAGYLSLMNHERVGKDIPMGRKIAIEDMVTRAEHHTDHEELSLKNGLVIYAARYPEFAYGDRIRLEGVVRVSRSRLIAGTVAARHTPIKLISRNGGSALKRKLFDMKRVFEENLNRLLPHTQAAFLSGLTLGTTEGFSNEFKDELRKTGTTHLVALSGSNATMIFAAASTILALPAVPRTAVFWPAFAFLWLFTLMTGAEASLVRAAIMNGIAGFGARIERKGGVGYAILAGAVVMALWNPLVAAFDLGFKLSFAAILGLAYLKPIVKRISPLKQDWFLNAASAQLGVMPVLAITVGHTSLLSIVPNILIAPVVPIATLLGFIAALLSLASDTLAFAPAWLAGLCLIYAMEVIHIFARYM